MNVRTETSHQTFNLLEIMGCGSLGMKWLVWSLESICILDNYQGEEKIISSRYEDTYQQGLLHSTKNYTQYLIVIYEGKESEKAHGWQELDTT